MHVNVSDVADAMMDIEKLCPQFKVGFMCIQPDNKGMRERYWEVSVEDVEGGILFLKDYEDVFEASAVLQGIYYGMALALGKEL